MGKFRIEIDKNAQRDFEKIFLSGDKITIKKVEKMILELSVNPYTGTGHPEPLNPDSALDFVMRENMIK
jgi:toxin YoeB